MRNKYCHLRYEERVEIVVRSRNRESIRSIARELGRAPSTISRELSRNVYLGPNSKYEVYQPHIAEVAARKRRKRGYRKPLLKSKFIQRYVESKLLLGWSPELIAGRMRFLHWQERVSHEAIYQWLYKERRDLLDHLVRHHKQRKKRGQSKRCKRFKIPDLTSILERPKYINQRTQFGHWESDSMVSDQSLGALHVVVERKSRYAIITKLKRNRAIDVKRALVKKMKALPHKARASFTYDHGGENTTHIEINQILDSRSFFCQPYCSWEKGTVENTIGVIRRTYPKKTDFSAIDKNNLVKLQKRMNSRPRKCLDYRTPDEVFKKELVALQR